MFIPTTLTPMFPIKFTFTHELQWTSNLELSSRLSFKTFLQLGNDNLKFKSTTFVNIDYFEEELPYYLIALHVFAKICAHIIFENFLEA